MTLKWAKLQLVVILWYAWHQLKQILLRFWPFLERPIVEVRQGGVQGVTAKLPNGERYHYFKCIPYSKPPVGELRFRPPVPLERFEQPVLNCSYERDDFVQIQGPHDLRVVGTESSLHLSVFTPGLPPEGASRYPVIVYIPGGGLRACTNSTFIYDPVHIVQQGVVVVTVAYRVGPLGFLYLPDAGISGNAGLKDQRLALKWVHENISKFRGDTENVTLMGQSAGAWSAYLHYLSPNSRKYFHRAIFQSGDACTESVFQLDPEEKARKLAKLLGCRGSSDREVLSTYLHNLNERTCKNKRDPSAESMQNKVVLNSTDFSDALMKAPAAVLTQAQLKICSPGEVSCPMRYAFRPVIERDLTADSIICQPPEQILKAYDTLRMPIMSSLCSAEGMLGVKLSRKRLHKYNHEEMLVPQFLGCSEKLDRQSVGKKVKQFYFGDRKVGQNTLNAYCDYASDYTFAVTSQLSAEWIARYQPNVEHFHSYFSYDGRLNYVKAIMGVDIPGASHSDDLYYLFSAPFVKPLPEDCDEYKIREIVLKTVTNFAKFGNPTPDESMLGFQWTPVSTLPRDAAEPFDLDCLEVNLPPRMIRNPNQYRNEFWRKIILENTNLL